MFIPPFSIFYCFSQFSWYLDYWYITLVSDFLGTWSFDTFALQGFLILYFFIGVQYYPYFSFFFALFYRFFLIILSRFHCLFFLFWIFMIFSFLQIQVSVPPCWQSLHFMALLTLTVQWTFIGCIWTYRVIGYSLSAMSTMNQILKELMNLRPWLIAILS